MKKTIALILTAVALSGCFNIKLNKDGFLTVNDGNLVFSSKRIKSEGPAVKKVYDTEAFSAIKILGAYDIDFAQGDSTLVEVEAAENIHEVLDIKAVDGVLILSTKDKVNVDKVSVTITNPTLNSLGIMGAGDVDIDGAAADEDFELEINGTGDVNIKKLSCKDMDVKINGAGDLDIEDLDCKDLNIKINGTGDAVLSGKAENVDASINGVGEIDAKALEVSGNFNKKVSGIGKVTMH